ncbi:unnamed protein product, partial [Rotaria sordida]
NEQTIIDKRALRLEELKSESTIVVAQHVDVAIDT